MLTLYAKNVCHAYARGMNTLREIGIRESSRAGDVLVSPVPVVTVYSRPTERVLFDAGRDANPFFHLMESVWMLSGSSDGRWLDRYVSDFSSRFAEKDGSIHGAYGKRWRSHFTRGETLNGILQRRDQLLEIGDMMYRDATTRQAVLTMWDPLADLGAVVKDKPCNTHVYLRAHQLEPSSEMVLDITVCCRSNDIIWGAYGANAVHMSVMGEVLAGLAGMRLGMYYQVSNNWHAYVDPFEKLHQGRLMLDDRYGDSVEATPILPHRLSSRHDLREAAQDVLEDCSCFLSTRDSPDTHIEYQSAWFNEVVAPMHRAHSAWKSGDRQTALGLMDRVAASDWRVAGQEWMARRIARGVRP